MAEIIPNEGLDYWLNIMLKGGTPPTNTHLFLFTGLTASTVPAASATLAAPSGWAEAAYTGYARQAVSQADWGTVGGRTVWGDATVRGYQGAQKSFPAATAAYATAINGFGLSSLGSGGVALLFSNFDDTTAVATLGIGDVIRVTPTYGLAP